MKTTETAWDLADYRQSLGNPNLVLPSGWRPDGAWLYRVDPEHLLVVARNCCDSHTGHRDLVKTYVPDGWICFAQFFNPDEELDYFHYGPEFTDGQLRPAPAQPHHGPTPDAGPELVAA